MKFENVSICFFLISEILINHVLLPYIANDMKLSNKFDQLIVIDLSAFLLQFTQLNIELMAGFFFAALCSAGYSFDGSGCQECSNGTYKSLEGNSMCTPCPEGATQTLLEPCCWRIVSYIFVFE